MYPYRSRVDLLYVYESQPVARPVLRWRLDSLRATRTARSYTQCRARPTASRALGIDRWTALQNDVVRRKVWRDDVGQQPHRLLLGGLQTLHEQTIELAGVRLDAQIEAGPDAALEAGDDLL